MKLFILAAIACLAVSRPQSSSVQSQWGIKTSPFLQPQVEPAPYETQQQTGYQNAQQVEPVPYQQQPQVEPVPYEPQTGFHSAVPLPYPIPAQPEEVLEVDVDQTTVSYPDTDTGTSTDTDSVDNSATDFNANYNRYKRQSEDGTDNNGEVKPFSHIIAILQKKRQEAYDHHVEESDSEDYTTTVFPMTETESESEGSEDSIVPMSFNRPQIEEMPQEQVEDQPLPQSQEENNDDLFAPSPPVQSY